MIDITKSFIIIMVLCTFLAYTVLYFSKVTILQYFLCCISLALFQPLIQLILSVIRGLFK